MLTNRSFLQKGGHHFVMPTFFVMLDSYLSIAKQDVVDASDVNGCHFSVAVHVAGGEKSLVASEQVVVDASDINGSYLAITVHIAIDTARGCCGDIEFPLIWGRR